MLLFLSLLVIFFFKAEFGLYHKKSKMFSKNEISNKAPRIVYDLVSHFTIILSHLNIFISLPMNHFSAAAKKKLVSDFLNKRMFMYLDIFMVPVAYRSQLSPRVCVVLLILIFSLFGYPLDPYTCGHVCYISLFCGAQHSDKHLGQWVYTFWCRITLS